MDAERLEQVLAALDAGTSKAAVCRSFQAACSTLLGTLERVGWTGAGRAARPEKASTRNAAAG